MPSSYELFIGLRYTRAERRNHYISFISLISLLGITLGMTALITVMSVMNGFQEEIRTRILGVASHIEISGMNEKLANWQEIANTAAKHPQVEATAPYVNAQGMVSFNQIVRGVLIRGIQPKMEDKVANFSQMMISGDLNNLKPKEFGIVIGAELAQSLGASKGDKIVLISPQGQITPVGILPRLKQFTITGIFKVGHFEYDSTLALVHIEDAQKLYQMDSAEVSGIRLKLQDLFQSKLIAQDLVPMMPAITFINDWTEQHANYFRALQIEKRMLSLILALLILVAAFNIVSTLVMAVTDKQPDIAILRTLGANPKNIMYIFMIQGTLIGAIGTALGILGGVLLAYNIDSVIAFIEHLFTVQFLSREVYYINEVPSDPHFIDIATVAILSFGLTILATIYPSYRASKVNPAEALRYE
ncbi:MAG: lipoprotein-releasing system transmembrane subunit LolC [Nitrosomonadaceae bacterium]|nr:lipoprotein-releasing system transmembrane subunit LolC [Nitrosomonadaceae bacterium]